MFAKLGILLLAAQGIAIPIQKTPRQIVKPKAPIEVAGPRWAKACADTDPMTNWSTPAPPVRIHADTYDVGTCGISVILIRGSQGDVLIDGGPEEATGAVVANIKALGFKVTDIKYILTSHEHHDHVGAISALQKLSGATLVTSAPAARVFTTGAASADDPQAGALEPFPAATVGRVIRDGEQVRVGDIMVEAMATPGHTPGALSWRWFNCDGGVCRMIVYADSLSAVSRDGYKFSDHPGVVADFRKSFAKVAASPCEILITPHPGSSDMGGRFAKGEPLLDEGACKAYAAKQSAALDARLAKEQAR